MTDDRNTDDLAIVEGGRGEGGGQIVRSSLTLAAITGRTVEVRNVRAARKGPGLKAQHVTAARAVAQICDGQLSGDDVGSRVLRIQPGAVRGGEYCFDVGTAGSTMLVLQTVLPVLLTAEQPSDFDLIGGTHNIQAPPADYVERVFLPALRTMGAEVSMRVRRRGFYPRGGGHVEVHVEPTGWRPLRLFERGDLMTRKITALCARLPREIGEREVRTATAGLGWRPKDAEVVVDDESLSEGNVLLVEMKFENVCELISSHGRIGLPAEKVAKRAVREANRFLDSDAAVGEHLADQLLLPMALAARQGAGASRFRTGPLSLHATTQIDLLRQLLDVPIEVEADGEQSLVTVG